MMNESLDRSKTLLGRTPAQHFANVTADPRIPVVLFAFLFLLLSRFRGKQISLPTLYPRASVPGSETPSTCLVCGGCKFSVSIEFLYGLFQKYANPRPPRPPFSPPLFFFLLRGLVDCSGVTGTGSLGGGVRPVRE